MSKKESKNYNHLSKKEVIDTFTLEQLKEIIIIFKLKCANNNKTNLVACIEKSRSVSKSFLTTLSDIQGSTVREKIKNIRNVFYDNFIQKRNDLLDDTYILLAECITPSLCSDTERIQLIETVLRQLEEFHDEELPDDLKNNGILSSKQTNAYYAVKNEVKNIRKLSIKILENAKDEPHFQDILEIGEKIKNEKVRYYLIEARKCYAIKSYDATVVMIARANEYALKEFFKKNNILYSEKDTLGALVNKFKDNFKDKPSQRLLGKIEEVQNFDRIVGAHDLNLDRKYITKDETDHSWTAIQLILNELIDIDYKPYLE